MQSHTKSKAMQKPREKSTNWKELTCWTQAGRNIGQLSKLRERSWDAHFTEIVQL